MLLRCYRVFYVSITSATSLRRSPYPRVLVDGRCRPYRPRPLQSQRVSSTAQCCRCGVLWTAEDHDYIIDCVTATVLPTVTTTRSDGDSRVPVVSTRFLCPRRSRQPRSLPTPRRSPPTSNVADTPSSVTAVSQNDPGPSTRPTTAVDGTDPTAVGHPQQQQRVPRVRSPWNERPSTMGQWPVKATAVTVVIVIVTAVTFTVGVFEIFADHTADSELTLASACEIAVKWVLIMRNEKKKQTNKNKNNTLIISFTKTPPHDKSYCCYLRRMQLFSILLRYPRSADVTSPGILHTALSAVPKLGHLL